MQRQMHLCVLSWIVIGSSKAETWELEKQNMTQTEVEIKTAVRTSLPKMELCLSKSDEYAAKTQNGLPALQVQRGPVTLARRTRQVHTVVLGNG